MKITKKIKEVLPESLEFIKSHPNFEFIGIDKLCTKDKIDDNVAFANKYINP